MKNNFVLKPSKQFAHFFIFGKLLTLTVNRNIFNRIVFKDIFKVKRYEVYFRNTN